MSTINPFALALTLFMGLLIIILPRKLAIVPMIIIALYQTFGQQIIIFELNFYMLRILMLFGIFRIIFREGIYSISLNPIDKAILWWLAVTIITYSLARQTSDALINRLGFAYNVIGTYFFFRFLICDIDDINRVFKIIAILIVPIAFIMLYESRTGTNPFAVFGGVLTDSELRNGIPRCQGPFGHPILAGTFGATLVPLFVSFWWQSLSGKIFACVGIIAAMIITVTSNSSGPVMTLLFAVVGLSVWPIRNHMKAVRWGLCLTLLALHFFIMKAPVWYLTARISEMMGSGGGWYRSYLIEQTVNHFNEWWFIGAKDTAIWMPFSLSGYPGQADITNQFVAEGVNGGLVKLILFILILVRCFQGLGERLRVTDDREFPTKIFLWAMGSALLAHIVSFFSVSYFDQIYVFWYLLLACISTVSLFPKSIELSENVHAEATL